MMIVLSFSLMAAAAVMRSDGFEYLKENCANLQSELLKTVAGCEEQFSGGGSKSRSVWGQFSDGDDHRSIRQPNWENRTSNLWVPLGDPSGRSPDEEEQEES